MHNGMYYCDNINQDFFAGNCALVQPSQTLPFIPVNGPRGCTNAPLQANQQPPVFNVSPQSSVAPGSTPMPTSCNSSTTTVPQPVMWGANSLYGSPQVLGGSVESSPYYFAPKDSNGVGAPSMQPVYVLPQPTVPWRPVVYMFPTVPVQQVQQQQNVYSCTQPLRQAHIGDAAPLESHFMPVENVFPKSSSQENISQLSAVNIDTTSELDEAGRKKKININIVCRHFMKSCCNRRKCRFLHATESSLLSHVSPSTSTIPGALPEDVVVTSSSASSTFDHESTDHGFQRIEELVR